MRRTASTERRSRVAILRFRPLWPYPARQWKQLVGVGLVTIVASFATALQPLPLKLLIDNGIGDRAIHGLPARLLGAIGLDDLGRRGIVTIAAAMTLLLTLLFAAMTAVLNWQWEIAGQSMVSDLMRTMHRALQRLSLQYHQQHDPGDLLSRAQWDSESIYTATSSLLIAPVVSLLTIGVVGWSAWNQSVRLTVVVVAVAPVLAVVTSFFGPRLRAKAKASREAQSAMVSFVTSVMHTLPVVQSFTGEERNLDQFRTLSDQAVATTRRDAFVAVLAESVGMLVSNIGAGVVLVLGGREVASGSMSLGTLLVFLIYVAALQSQAESLMILNRLLRAAEASLDRVMEVMESNEVIPEPVSPRSLRQPSRAPAIVFERVTAGYDAGRPVLDNIDLTIEPGEVVAIIGRTGAGKSTLVSLVSRVIDPWQGRVQFNGVDVRDVSLGELRAQVAVVRQQPILLSGSVADNIAYGSHTVSRHMVHQAARATRCDEFIRQMQDGYDTIIGEGGVTLSGGQRQRIAIARAILKPATVLVLDEPTSALDADAEQAIVDLLGHMRGHRTTLVIAHRLTTARAASRIVVLDAGRVVETGTHDELIAADGIYARFHELQTRSPTP